MISPFIVKFSTRYIDIPKLKNLFTDILKIRSPEILEDFWKNVRKNNRQLNTSE